MCNADCNRMCRLRTLGLNMGRSPLTVTQQTKSKTFGSFCWDFNTLRSRGTDFREIYYFNRKHSDFIKNGVKNDN